MKTNCTNNSNSGLALDFVPKDTTDFRQICNYPYPYYDMFLKKYTTLFKQHLTAVSVLQISVKVDVRNITDS